MSVNFCSIIYNIKALIFILKINMFIHKAGRIPATGTPNTILLVCESEKVESHWPRESE
jgi:hypothetical protein